MRVFKTSQRFWLRPGPKKNRSRRALRAHRSLSIGLITFLCAVLTELHRDVQFLYLLSLLAVLGCWNSENGDAVISPLAV